MDKKQKVRFFLESGVLVSPKLMDKINEDNKERILQLAKQSDDTVLTNMEETALSIKVKKIRERNRLGVQDFVKYYNNKYNGIRKLLSKKMDATSVNNAKQAFSEVSVIGMVKELTPRGFVLEDPTGEISVIRKDEDKDKQDTISISVDDVIGLTGFVKEGRMFVRETILPDVSLSNKAGRIDINLLLTTQMTERLGSSAQDVSFIIIPQLADNPNPKRIISGLGNPAWMTLSKGKTKVVLLFYSPDQETGPQQAINWLKKRHLCPRKELIRTPEDPFLLYPVPTVFWLVQKKTWSENYKGVNIISCSRDTFAKVNLWSMESKFYPHEKTNINNVH